MGYHVVDPDEIEPIEGNGREIRSISGAAELENVGLNVFDVPPGAQLPLTYHYHEEQEEAFFVVSGTLRVETPEEEFIIEEGQCFVAEPENPHRAFNPEDADDAVRALAIGAPRVDDVNRYEP